MENIRINNLHEEDNTWVKPYAVDNIGAHTIACVLCMRFCLQDLYRCRQLPLRGEGKGKYNWKQVLCDMWWMNYELVENCKRTLSGVLFRV